ncbi:MAG: PilX N-terminal domain-containing pilus assembly protein [Pseudomonadota bacterium]|nr:PilX N-terminal domain-containing pilus assembly protein [Pseudomonadota bacterium]
MIGVNPERKLQRKQRGAALLMGLVLLLIMTLLGISAMRGTTLQERMAGALHEQNLALQSAESALRAGEKALRTSVTLNFSKPGWYDSNETDKTPDWENKATTLGETGDGVVKYSPDGDAKENSPQYYVVRIPVVQSDSTQGTSMALGDGTVNTEYDMYRVVARGFGNNTRSVVVLESTFRR